ncbi:MAG: phytanoyl-CoA dioxygenase family protein [Egibacteraceae bacterium]
MTPPSLSDAEVAAFVRDGFVRLPAAFSRSAAADCVELFWAQMPAGRLDRTDTVKLPGPIVRDDPSTWVKPKIRLWFDQADEPVRRAMNTCRLHGAYDQLAGAGRWRAEPFFSSEVRVRFPDHGAYDVDDEWHVDHAFGLGDSVGLNLTSSLRAFLLLVLLTDVGPNDAPRMLRAGSHVAAARVFAETGDEPLRWDEVVPRIADLDDYPIVSATGDAGDVYLCHPVIVHTAQSHHGTTPRFAAQVGLQLREPMSLYRPDGDYSPLEQATRLGVDQASQDAGSPLRLPRAQARSPF